MIGIYDEPVAVPIIDLLDSSMMSQYISAAREQYNQALQDQKEFAKEFGDLYSPSVSLNKAYYDQTKGRVNAGLNYLYQNGIDPLRSAEGRAYIAKIIRETPYDKISKWKADADNMKTFQKAAASMVAEGKLTQDQLGWQMQKYGLDYDKFDPYTQSWNTLAPTKMDTLEDLTKIPYSVLKPSNLTQKQVEAMGYKYDPKNDYTGITDQMIMDTAGKAIPSVMSTAAGEYYYDKAKQQLQQAGVTNPTDDQVKQQLQGTVAQLWEGKKNIAWDPNKYSLLDYQNVLADKLDAKKSARDLASQKAIIDYKYADDVRRANNPSIQNSSSSSRSGRGSKPKNLWTIFDVAYNKPGQSAGLGTTDDYQKEGVAFSDPGVQVRRVKNNGEYQTVVTFKIGDAHPVKRGGFKSNGTTTPPWKKAMKGKQVNATVMGGLTYNAKTGKYYVRCKLDNTSEQTDETLRKWSGVTEFWLPVNETHKGSPSNTENQQSPND